MTRILLFIFFLLVPEICESQDDKWTFFGYGSYTKIPNSCRKKADFGVIFLKKNKNYSNNLAKVKQRLDKEFEEFIYTKYYHFSPSQGGVYKVFKINSECGSKRANWTGYHILVGDSANIDTKFASYVKSTTGIKSTQTYITGFLDISVKNIKQEVFSLHGISMNSIGALR